MTGWKIRHEWVDVFPFENGHFPISHVRDLRGVTYPTKRESRRIVYFWKTFTLQGTNISPKKWHFEDEFPFPKVGYVNSLKGTLSFITMQVENVWKWLFGDYTRLPRTHFPLNHDYMGRRLLFVTFMTEVVEHGCMHLKGKYFVYH